VSWLFTWTKCLLLHLDYLSSERELISTDSDSTFANNVFPESFLSTQLFSYGEINDLASWQRVLDLYNKSSGLLGLRLKKIFYNKIRLTGTISCHLSPKKMILCTVTMLQAFWKSFVCQNMIQTLKAFISSSKQSLNFVILHNDSTFESIPLGQSASWFTRSSHVFYPWGIPELDPNIGKKIDL